LWVYFILSILPFVFWRFWMQTWPMSIPASGWLFNGTQIRFKPAWWHWIFQIRLDKYMFNFSGLLFIGMALFFFRNVYEALHRFPKDEPDSKKYLWFWPLCLISCASYIVVFATGNVQHEYYQLPITAFGSLFVSLGFCYVWTLRGSWVSRIFRRVAAIVLLGFVFLLGWYSVKEWYVIGNPMLVTVGKRADSILPKNAKVIADYGGDTTFLYYINRIGWSVREKQVQEMIDRGATHYISMHRNDYINKLATLYEIVDETPEYVILDLRKQKGEWMNIGKYEL
jgi:hypothetical protein